jgi:predicted MFS family arabinose efflux permease
VTANVRDYRRGLAYVSFFSALASTIAIPLVSLLISAVGWRHSLMVQAGVQLLGPVCVNAIVLRGTRGSRAGERGKPASEREPSPVRRVLRMPAFWFLALACSVHWFIAMGLSMHILPLMQERGLSLQTAVAMMMINGPAAVAGRLMMFFLVPGSSGVITGRFMFPLFAAGTLLLALASDFSSFVAYAVTFGMSAGVLMIVRQTSVAEIFGTRGYGAISGALAMVSIVPRTSGSLTVAVMHDWFGSYDPVVWILFGLTVVGTAAFYLAAASRRGD